MIRTALSSSALIGAGIDQVLETATAAGAQALGRASRRPNEDWLEFLDLFDEQGGMSEAPDDIKLLGGMVQDRSCLSAATWFGVDPQV
jgi:hypothetical protein